jgi:hypothetical protein
MATRARCYHGWLFDVDEAILETLGEPATNTLKGRRCRGAYPTHEYNRNCVCLRACPSCTDRGGRSATHAHDRAETGRVLSRTSASLKWQLTGQTRADHWR